MAVKTFDSMQALCDYAVQQIVAQGGACVDDMGMCYYQDGERHCAVGWVLDPEHGEAMASEITVGKLLQQYPEAMPVLTTGEPLALRTLQRLQLFHDSPVQEDRAELRQNFRQDGIDTSAPHWQAWIAMGRN